VDSGAARPALAVAGVKILKQSIRRDKSTRAVMLSSSFQKTSLRAQF
jgi:hypothetical protein